MGFCLRCNNIVRGEVVFRETFVVFRDEDNEEEGEGDESKEE